MEFFARLPQRSRQCADRPRRGLSVPLRRSRVGGWATKPKDGFADFFGYEDEASNLAPPAKAEAPRDGFADFFGYPEDDAAVPAELHTVFLPDRDPDSSPCGRAGREGPGCEDRLWVDATEASLAIIRAQIESKRRLLHRAQGKDAEELKQEMLRLKLQQARLAEAIWQEGQSAHVANPSKHIAAFELSNS